jgi:hypothetical protein
MIPGVVCQRRRVNVGGGGGPVLPDWLPAGAVAHLDWVNGNYWAGGAERADTDILGGDYNPAKIDARGLFMQLGAEMYGPTAIGSLFTDLLNYLQAGATVVIDIDALDAPADFPEGTILYFFDNADPDLADEFLEVKFSTSPRSVNMGDSQTLTITGSSPNIFDDEGVQAAAFTINAPVAGPLFRYALSINEGAQQQTDKSYNASYLVPATIRLFAVQEWDYGMEDVYVRRLTLFPAAADAADYSALYFTPDTPAATFADVVFLCHWNGSDADTTATDQSGSAHTITFNGSAELDTAQKKFGTASLMLPNDTTDSVAVANDADFQFGSGAFVVEGFVRFDSVPDAQLEIRCSSEFDLSWSVHFPGSGHIIFRYSLDGSTEITISTATGLITDDTQHYFCVERGDSGALRITIDDTIVKTGAMLGAINASAADLEIRPSGTATVWVDELRITKGGFWYGETPDQPASEFPNS